MPHTVEQSRSAAVKIRNFHCDKDSFFFFSGIQPDFGPILPSAALQDHIERIQSILHQIIPQELILKGEEFILDWLNNSLPQICWSTLVAPPNVLSIYLLCKASRQSKAENLFLNIIQKWLIPEKQIQVLSAQHMYFHLKILKGELFFVSEVKILVESGRDALLIQANLPNLSREIAFAIYSPNYANHILSTRALAPDQKASAVHQELVKVYHRKPNNFQSDLFLEMGKFLALIAPDFIKFRSHRHIAKLLVAHYLMKKQIKRLSDAFPEKRHLHVKWLPCQLVFPFGSKSVLGVVISLSLADKHEFFDETHILLAVQEILPSAQLVKDSFYCYQGQQESVRMLYVEIEKIDGEYFSIAEMAKLKKELGEELKKRIEKLIPAVFMIRNEEETFKNLFILSQECKKVTDLPQVMISFDKQEEKDVSFRVILVRPLKKTEKSLEELFTGLNEKFQFKCDRKQITGNLRKTIAKEASVFYFTLPKDKALLRADLSVNFYFARQRVVSILTQALGEFRDYNGGMILKQGELFTEFKQLFTRQAEKSQELLENFFFSLTPIELQATIALSSLKTLFLLCLEAIECSLPKKENYFFKHLRQESLTFALIRIREDLIKDVEEEDLDTDVSVKTQFAFQGSQIFGFIYEEGNLEKHKEFIDLLEKKLRSRVRRLKQQQTLKLSSMDLPFSLDPRLGGDDISGNILKMLFEGLMRIGRANKPELALAEAFDVSPDKKTYLFRLRKSIWSNGDPVTAYDFEYSWKKILTPGFYTPFAYFFYPIKNAKKAKEGLCAITEVGIFAQDERTLIVELEHPTPEFLELTAHALYSPVNHKVDRLHPNWSQGQEESYVCTGPFCLKKQQQNSGYELIKNKSYWDASTVKLEKIFVVKNNPDIAKEMFRNEEIDWLGRPLRPWEPFFAEGAEIPVCVQPLGTFWLVLNVEKFPFNNKKMRRAFGLVIDRTKLVADLSYEGPPATTVLPLAHTQNYDSSLLHADLDLARQLFEEALIELGIDRRDFPVVTLAHNIDKTREKAAQLLQQQLQDGLGIVCRTESYEFSMLFQKLTQGDFQLGTVSWKAWINNPMYTLSPFKYASNRINFSNWEDSDYQKLLGLAQEEVDETRRMHYLKEAEKILSFEMPVIPIYYEVHQYMAHKRLKDAVHSHTGNADFRWAYIDPEE